MSITFKPMGARLLVKPEPAATMIGLIHIPESAQKKSLRGEVIAMGPGMLMKNGKRWPMPDVQIGDTVLFHERSGAGIKIDDVAYVVLRDDDVIGVEETTIADEAAAQ